MCASVYMCVDPLQPCRSIMFFTSLKATVGSFDSKCDDSQTTFVDTSCAGVKCQPATRGRCKKLEKPQVALWSLN